MNCFDWQNRASDYLDGSLAANFKREADEHLEKCDDCGEKYKHYRLLLSSISSQPRNPLPATVRKAPLAVVPPLRKMGFRDRLRKWSEAPWYIRVPVEGGGIVLIVSLAVSAGPRFRSFYERKVERSLTEYNEGFGNDEADDSGSAHLGRGKQAETAAAGAPPAAQTDDFSSSEGDSSDDSADAGDDGNDDEPAVVKATSSDTWRFNLKTDSPHEVRTKIVEILQGLNVPPNTAGIGGIEAPGGIQFDLIVPQVIIPDLKAALEKIAPAAPKELEDSPFGETFTWYKKKSRSPVPAGQTHVVIWLAQI